MSEFHVEVVRIGAIEKHPNADTLSITMVHGGYPVIMRTGDFAEGDLAVYVPIDAIVPADDERWAFLAGHRRIKAKRLRGVFSMGLLTKADPAWVEGQDVQAELRIEKYEPAIEQEYSLGACADNAHDPGYMPKYTDIEGQRKWRNAFQEGEQVVVTEKIHGANARYLFLDGQLYCGSRTRIKKNDAACAWTRVAEAYSLAEKLAMIPGVAVYGEVYGQVQDLKYGVPSGERFIVFDMFDTQSQRWLSHTLVQAVCGWLGLDSVPVVYKGPYDDTLLEERNGPSLLAERYGAKQIREGVVIKPAVERFDPHNGRVIVKCVGEDYLLRKEAV